MPRKTTKRTPAPRTSLLPWVLLIIFVIGALAFYAPLFPSITVNFAIEPNPKSGDVPIVSTLGYPVLYEKLSLTASASVPKGKILLLSYTNVSVTSASGFFLLKITVIYGSQTLSPDTVFAVAAAPGFYTIRVVYSPIAEQLGVPYSVRISAALQGNQTYVGTIVNVLPS